MIASPKLSVTARRLSPLCFALAASKRSAAGLMRGDAKTGLLIGSPVGGRLTTGAGRDCSRFARTVGRVSRSPRTCARGLGSAGTRYERYPWCRSATFDRYAMRVAFPSDRPIREGTPDGRADTGSDLLRDRGARSCGAQADPAPHERSTGAIRGEDLFGRAAAQHHADSAANRSARSSHERLTQFLPRPTRVALARRVAFFRNATRPPRLAAPPFCKIAHVSGEDEVRRLKMLVHFKVGR